MAAPLPVIVNHRGGTAAASGDGLAARIERAFAAARVAIELRIVEPGEVSEVLAQHADAPRIVVGGGDGTIGTAASHCAGTATELAVLPLGTRNHFARQLDIPLDLDEAAALAAGGHTALIDCGTAGPHTFVNNLSIGAYPDLVRAREASPLPRWPASVFGALGIFGHWQTRRYELVIDGEPAAVATSVLFVGNNRYEVAEGKPAERSALDDGALSLYALAPLSRLGLARAALRILFTKPDMRRDFALQRPARSVRVAGRGWIAVAIDGEERDMALPFDIAINPRALRIVAPAG